MHLRLLVQLTSFISERSFLHPPCRKLGDFLPVLYPSVHVVMSCLNSERREGGIVSVYIQQQCD
jgi:hypothetical protein